MTPDTNPTALRAEARAKRLAFASSPESRFVRTMKECITDYSRAIAEGVSQEDAVKGLESVLRAESPFRISKFKDCDGCGGSGRRLLECNHALRCGREACSEREEGYAHTYVVPCECDKGDKFRARPTVVEDDLAQAARAKRRKQTGWTQWGR